MYDNGIESQLLTPPTCTGARVPHASGEACLRRRVHQCRRGDHRVCGTLLGPLHRRGVARRLSRRRRRLNERGRFAAAQGPSVANARPPARVAAGNVETGWRITDVLSRALAQALPELIPALAGDNERHHGWRSQTANVRCIRQFTLEAGTGDVVSARTPAGGGSGEEAAWS